MSQAEVILRSVANDLGYVIMGEPQFDTHTKTTKAYFKVDPNLPSWMVELADTTIYAEGICVDLTNPESLVQLQRGLELMSRQQKLLRRFIAEAVQGGKRLVDPGVLDEIQTKVAEELSRT